MPADVRGTDGAADVRSLRAALLALLCPACPDWPVTPAHRLPREFVDRSEGYGDITCRLISGIRPRWRRKAESRRSKPRCCRGDRRPSPHGALHEMVSVKKELR